LKERGNSMARFFNHRNILNQCVVLLTALIALGGFLSGIARALPPPKPVEELFHDSDLVIKAQVARVSLYSQWLSQVRSGELGEDAAALAKNLPDSDAGLLRLLHNFPYNTSQVAIDGVYIAELKVEEVLKGKSQGMIFIPFVRYHFLANRSMEGPWSERTYKPGERLNLYLKKNGPFYESAWWNAVHPVK
jgi:hypothetical protein